MPPTRSFPRTRRDGVGEGSAAVSTELVLASSSRHRRALLERLGLPFVAVSPKVEETALAHETPTATALRLAEEKAMAVAKQYPKALVIGSDQVAELDGRPLGKPLTRERAAAQLAAMSARTVLFHTGLCVLRLEPPSAQPCSTEPRCVCAVSKRPRSSVTSSAKTCSTAPARFAARVSASACLRRFAALTLPRSSACR